MSIPQTPSPLSNILTAKTYNAAWFSGSTKEAQITTAIAAAVTDGALYVYVPANMLPYNAVNVVFSNAVKMIREGGDHSAFDVVAYGAAGDGIIDDSPAINAAWTAVTKAGGRLKLSLIHSINSNLIFALGDPHMGVVIEGVFGATVIKPTAAVTIALTVSCTSTDANGLASRFSMQGVRIDGANTNGAVGLLVGDNISHISAYMIFRDVEIYGFHGPNAKGLYIKDLVGGLFDNVYVDRCTTDLYINPSDLALPTALSFRFCQFREADVNGIEIWNGYRIHFFQTVVESNFGRGIWIVPTSGAANVLWIEFDGLWCESNCRNDATQYQLHVDGTLAGTVEIRVVNTNWSGVARSIYLKSAHSCILDNIYPRSTAGSVFIDSGVNGFIRNWPHNNVVYATAVTNNSLLTMLLDVTDSWKDKITVDQVTGSLGVISGTPNLGSVTNRFGKAFFTSIASYYNQPSYGAIVTIDPSTGNFQQVIVTDNLAFTMANPINPALSMPLTVQIRNTSGGAMGVITWGAAFKLAGAFTNPATGNNRQISFVYDSGNLKWYESSRSAADVPN